MSAEGVWCTVQFGTHAEAKQVVDMEPTRSQFSFASVLDGEHPLLTRMEALHVHEDPLPVSPNVFDRRFGLRFVPNIQDAILVKVRGVDMSQERLQFIEEWIVGRRGRIGEVTIDKCDDMVHEFARGLVQRGIIPTLVSFEDDIPG
jgi:hypothetical protein